MRKILSDFENTYLLNKVEAPKSNKANVWRYFELKNSGIIKHEIVEQRRKNLDLL